MGVSGSGKTTVAQKLADDMGIHYLEADDFHPKSNIEKMKSGKALNDEDRWPWLDAINTSLCEVELKEQSCVLTCSALKESYRERMCLNLESKPYWIYLKGSFDLISKRMASRNHFMPPSLLQSQFDTLEEPDYGLEIDISTDLNNILNKIKQYIDAK